MACRERLTMFLASSPMLLRSSPVAVASARRNAPVPAGVPFLCDGDRDVALISKNERV